MRLLLDTHALLWWVDDDPQLSTQARGLIGDARNDCSVSLVSAWEMAIKCAIGKLKLAVSVQRYCQEHLPANDFQLLPINLGHCTLVETLPLHHRDPFDRLLIAQAWQEGLTLVSSERASMPMGSSESGNPRPAVHHGSNQLRRLGDRRAEAVFKANG